MTRTHYAGHFLLIDVGHPMNTTCISAIKKSLTNVLSLASCLNGLSRLPVFGCGTIGKKFITMQEWNFFYKNYPLFENNLNSLEDSPTGEKLTLKDYKTLLTNSIMTITCDFDFHLNEWRSKTDVKDKFDIHRYWPTQVHLTLVTRKSGFLIIEMIEKTVQMVKLKKMDIVEISDLANRQGMGKVVNCVSCYVVSQKMSDLECIFKKRWLLENELEEESLRIILDNDSGDYLRCDLNDCIINPINLNVIQNFYLSGNFPTLVSQKPVFLPDAQKTNELVVVSRANMSSVCPSTLFGFPQLVYATKTCTPRESRLFKALCRCLYNKEAGLIAELKQHPGLNQISALYFITSDGEKMLMQNMAPAELLLPPRLEFMANNDNDSEEEEQEESFVIGLILNKLDDFSPRLFSNAYSNLKQYLKPAKTETTHKAKSCVKSSNSAKTHKLQPGEYTPMFLNRKSTARKKCVDKDNTHPALLPPEAVTLYKKQRAKPYRLPELMEPGIMEK